MIGLLLSLAMMGQQCPGGSCAQPVRVVRQVSYSSSHPTPKPEWEDVACEILTGDGGLGSGTVLRSNEQGQELILTARHVIHSKIMPVSVRWKGSIYRARFVAASSEGDISAIEADLPGTVKTLELATHAPATAEILGYGQSRKLHRHSIRYIGRIYGDADDIYGPGGNEGDSGAGVFCEDGSLCGVFVAYENRTHNSVVVSAKTLCQFLAPSDQVQAQARSGSGRTRLVIFPFFWFGKTWNGGVNDVCPPSQPVTPTNPTEPPPVIAGQNGKDGLNGKDGRDGKDVDPAVLNAILSATKANADQINILIGEVNAIKTRPLPPPPLLKMTATDANGVPRSTKTYEPTVDPATGRLIYDVTMAPQTILTPAQ